MLIKNASLFALAGLTGLAYGQHTLSQKDRMAQGVVYRAASGEPPSMDPNKQADSDSGVYLAHIYEGLMTTNEQGNLSFGVAEKLDVSSDGLTYTFTLRKDAKWHDGKPVTAQDFEYSFKRVADPKYASEYSFILETGGFLNAAEVVAGKKPVDELGVKAKDDKTLVITLSKPVPFFKDLMKFSVFYPVRKDLVEKYGDKFNTEAEYIVGNGPFKLTEWKHDQSLVMEKVDTYWNNKAVKLKKFVVPVMLKDSMSAYNTFKTGGIDVVGFDKERLSMAQKDKFPITMVSQGTGWWFEFNLKEGALLSNKNLRHAIRVGMNRTDFVNKIIGIPGTKILKGYIPSYFKGTSSRQTYRKMFPIDFKDGDLKEAKKYVEAYLKETKQTKVPDMTLLSGDTANAKIHAEYFQQQLQGIFGNTVKVDAVPFKTRLQKMRDGDFDLVYAGWGPDYDHVMTFADLFLSTNENNHGPYVNKDFDSYIQKSQQELDVKKSLEYVWKAEEQIILKDAGLVGLFEPMSATSIHPKLKGVLQHTVGATWDFRYARWDK